MATLAIVVAALVAFGATFPLRRYAGVLGLLDLPGERSSHRVVTPRGGGVAIIAGVAAALAVSSLSTDLTAEAWMLFTAALLVGGIGLIDDRFGLHPISKLIAHVAAASIVVAIAGPIESLPLPPPLDVAIAPQRGMLLSLAWIVAVINFFNFMDGIDGLAAAQAAASCAGIGVAAWFGDAVLMAAAVGAACIGFLFHNAPPARVFMGDSGSGFLGFFLAAAPFLAPSPQRSDALLAVAIGLALFLLDPMVTLVRRAIQGKNILRAHREHLYQQLVAPEEPAGRVTTVYALTALALALLGAAGYRTPSLFWAGAVASVVAFGVVWWAARRGGSIRD